MKKHALFGDAETLIPTIWCHAQPEFWTLDLGCLMLIPIDMNFVLWQEQHKLYNHLKTLNFLGNLIC